MKMLLAMRCQSLLCHATNHGSVLPESWNVSTYLVSAGTTLPHPVNCRLHQLLLKPCATSISWPSWDFAPTLMVLSNLKASCWRPCQISMSVAHLSLLHILCSSGNITLGLLPGFKSLMHAPHLMLQIVAAKVLA